MKRGPYWKPNSKFKMKPLEMTRAEIEFADKLLAELEAEIELEKKKVPISFQKTNHNSKFQDDATISNVDRNSKNMLDGGQMLDDEDFESDFSDSQSSFQDDKVDDFDETPPSSPIQIQSPIVQQQNSYQSTTQQNAPNAKSMSGTAYAYFINEIQYLRKKYDEDMAEMKAKLENCENQLKNRKFIPEETTAKTELLSQGIRMMQRTMKKVEESFAKHNVNILPTGYFMTDSDKKIEVDDPTLVKKFLDSRDVTNAGVYALKMMKLNPNNISIQRKDNLHMLTKEEKSTFVDIMQSHPLPKVKTCKKPYHGLSEVIRQHKSKTKKSKIPEDTINMDVEEIEDEEEL